MTAKFVRYKEAESSYNRWVGNYLALIEESLRSKDYSSVNAVIVKYLKSEKYSKSSRLIASDFYRRISEYSKGLELLHWQNESFRWTSLGEKEIRIRLQSLRMLNLLGASSFATRILDTMSEEVQKKYYELIAPIYLSNEMAGAGVRLYSFLLELPEREWDYQKRLQLIGLADAYSGLKRYDEAIALGERLIGVSSEAAILAILNEALGSYHLNARNLKQAAIHQEKARSLFSESETTIDHGYLLRGIGARLALEGELAESQFCLNQAFSVLFRRGLKPEVWLDVLYWKGLLEFKKTGAMPLVWRRLLCYPIAHQRYRKEIAQWVQIPSEITFGVPGAKTIFHYHEDMCVEGENNTLGLSLPQKVLSLLVVGGEWGVPFYRICDAIWRDDLFSFDQLFKRLNQGLARLRREGWNVKWQDMHLNLRPDKRMGQTQVVMNLQPTIPGGLFFQHVISRNESRFTRDDIENYFSLSRSRAADLCSQWVSEKIVTPEKEGRSVYYRLINR